MCWEIFCCRCCRPRIDEETAVSNSDRKPPLPPSRPLQSPATNGHPVQNPLSPPSRPPSSLLKNGVSKPPGKDSEESPITTTAGLGDESSSQESDKVDPAIKKGNTKSEEGKQGPKPNAKKHPIHNTATDTPTKEKEHVKDVSSEKRGHERSEDCISLHEGKPTFEHTPEAAAAVSSKPSSAQKNEVVGSQANPKRTKQGERSVSMEEPSREAAEYYRFPSIDGIGSQANQGRIDQDQERHVSMKEPSESSPIPRKDQRRGEAADGGHARLHLQRPGIG